MLFWPGVVVGSWASLSGHLEGQLVGGDWCVFLGTSFSVCVPGRVGQGALLSGHLWGPVPSRWKVVSVHGACVSGFPMKSLRLGSLDSWKGVVWAETDSLFPAPHPHPR